MELIEGTEGDGVICVPDRDDWQAFHIVDAKGGDDVILGGAGVEWIYGGDGADTIHGNGGDDRIVAGAGADTVYGGPGMDSVHSIDTADTVIDDDHELVVAPSVAIAQSGPEPTGDWVWLDASQTVQIDVLGNDHDPNEDLVPATLTVTTAPSSGTVAVTADTDGVNVAEYTAPASGGSDSFSYEVCDSLGTCASAQVSVMVGTSGCTIIGTTGDDTIRGTPGDDVICGIGGDDTIRAIGGDDLIWGGPGADTLDGQGHDDELHGGAGADTLRGGAGNDRLWGGIDADTLDGGNGTNHLDGGPDTDTCRRADTTSDCE